MALKERKRSIFDFIYDNRIITAAFLFSTLFFLWQHSTGFSWDFASYVINAKYLAGSGYYYEWTRQPLPSAIMLALSFLGWAAAEYAYIIFVSLLHLYSSLKFSEKFSVDKTLFYVFSLNVYVLVFGQKLGSELLSLAFLQFFTAYLYEKKAGIFAGISVLARYSNVNFFPLLLFQKNARKIFFSLLLVFLVMLPWLYFSYAVTGNPLTSIRDSYMLNVVFRSLDGYVNSFNVLDFFFAFNLLLPLSALGFFSKKDEKYYVMLSFMAISVISYFLIPYKEERYLFPMTLPAAYFAAKAVERKKKNARYIAAFIIASVVLIALLLPIAKNEPPHFYKSINSECMAQSNAWVALNYYGVPSEPYPNKEDFSAAIEQGYRIILFKNPEFPLYMNNQTFMQQFPVLEGSEGHVIYGDASKCKPLQKYEMLFIDRIRKRIEDGDIECDFFSCRYLR